MANFILDKGYVSTGAVRQFSAVVRTAVKQQCAEASVLGALTLGVCQDEVSAEQATNGRVADIRVNGITRAIADGVIGVGVRVRTAADGRVTALAAATANQNVLGITETASAAAGDHLDVNLTPGAIFST